MTLRALIATLALAAVLNVAVGCGSDDDEPDREPARSSLPAPADPPAETDAPPSGTSDTGDVTPTPADPPDAGFSHRAFQTPTGNIGCAGDEAGIRCDIADYSYEPPHRPKSCDLDWGHAVSVGGEFPGQVVCAGDTILDPDAPVLEYGETNTVGSISCESSEAGIRCESAATGHGFVLSAQQVDVF